jgi:uncharacterized protein YhaN
VTAAGEGGGSPKCPATRADGTPCAGRVQTGAVYCWAHDPENASQRRENASHAATVKARKPQDLVEVKQRIRQLCEDVLKGEVDRSKASVAFQGFGVYVKVCEQERKQRESAELEARLEELEDLLDEERRRGVARY